MSIQELYQEIAQKAETVLDHLDREIFNLRKSLGLTLPIEDLNPAHIDSIKNPNNAASQSPFAELRLQQTAEAETSGGGGTERRASYRGIIGPLKSDLAQRVIDVLNENKNEIWNAVIRQTETFNYSPELLTRTFAHINQMSDAQIRHLHALDAWKPFVQVMARVDEASSLGFKLDGGLQLTAKILHDVCADHETKALAKQFLETMITYDGRISFLKNYLYILSPGKFNPYLVASQVQIEPQDSRKGVTAAVGASGTGNERPWEAFYPEQENSPRYPCGLEPMLKIQEAFCPGEYSRLVRQERRARRAQTQATFLENVSLEELLNAESDHPALKSRLLARNTEVFKALQEGIKELRGETYRLKYGDSVIFLAEGDSRIKSYSGRQMMGWFEDNFETLPAHIQRAYELLDNGVCKITREEEIFCTKGLVAYYFLQLRVDRASALGAIKKDLELYRELQKSSPGTFDSLELPANLERPKATKISGTINTDALAADLEEILQSRKLEITYAEVSQVISKFNFLADFREAMNRRERALFESEYSAMIARARNFFQSSDLELGGTITHRWLGDSASETVPLGRLKLRTPEGAKLGHSFGTDTTESLFTRNDFAALQAMLRLETLCKEDSRQFKILPIDSYRETLDAAMVAFRKSRHLRAQFAVEGVSIPIAPDIIEALKVSAPSFKPQLLDFTDYKPAERYTASKVNNGYDQHPQRLDEIIACGQFFRGQHRVIGSLTFPRHLDRLQEEARAGLYRESTALADLERFASRYVHHSELSKEIEAARIVLAHPAVVDPKVGAVNLQSKDLKQLEKQYFTSAEARTIQSLAEFQPTLAALDFSDLASLKTKLEKLNSFSRLDRITGTIAAGEPVKFIRHWAGMSSTPPVHETFHGTYGFQTYLSPTKLDGAMQVIQNDYILTENVRPEFFEKIRKLNTADGRFALSSQNIEWPHSGTVAILSQLNPNSNVLIEKKLVDAIIGLDLTVPSPTLKEGEFIGRGRKFQVLGGDLVIKFGTRYPDKSLVDTAAKDPSYLEYLVQNHSDAAVREICREALTHVSPGANPRASRSFKDLDQFKTWVAREFPSVK